MEIKNLKNAVELDLKKLEHKGVYVVYKEPLIVYKKVSGSRILKCIIPIGAKIVFPYGYSKRLFKHILKCRTDKLIPIEFVTRSGRKTIKQSPADSWRARSWNLYHSYKLNKVYEPHKALSTDTTDCCRSGIHFFTTLKEAARW